MRTDTIIGPLFLRDLPLSVGHLQLASIALRRCLRTVLRFGYDLPRVLGRRRRREYKQKNREVSVIHIPVPPPVIREPPIRQAPGRREEPPRVRVETESSRVKLDTDSRAASRRRRSF